MAELLTIIKKKKIHEKDETKEKPNLLKEILVPAASFGTTVYGLTRAGQYVTKKQRESMYKSKAQQED